MSLLVGCRWAAPKFCASMWWLLFICVMNVKTFEVLASNSTVPVYDSEYLFTYTYHIFYLFTYYVYFFLFSMQTTI